MAAKLSEMVKERGVSSFEFLKSFGGNSRNDEHVRNLGRNLDEVINS